MSNITVTLESGQTAVVGVASSREAYEVEVASGLMGSPGVSVVSANISAGMLSITLSNTAVINAGSVMGPANTGTITFTDNTIGQLSNSDINIATSGNVSIQTHMVNPSASPAIDMVSTWIFSSDGTTTFPTTRYPSSSRGAPGDVAGMMAFDQQRIYRCYADYTDGSIPIWSFVVMDTTDW